MASERTLIHDLAREARRRRTVLFGAGSSDLVGALAGTARSLLVVDADAAALERARARLAPAACERFAFHAGARPPAGNPAEVAVAWGGAGPDEATLRAALVPGGRAFFAGPGVAAATRRDVPGGALEEEPEDPGPDPIGPNDPKLTVVIPTRNRAAMLREAILSLCHQTYGNAEGIVIDDGSTDDSAEVGWTFPGRVRYFPRQHAGKGVALNAAMVAASGYGKALLILDDDDLLLPNAMVVLWRALQAHPEWGLVAGEAWVTDAGGSVTGYRALPDGAAAEPLRHLFRGNFLPQPAVLVRREVIASAGPFDETLSHGVDFDFWFRVCRAARLGIVHVPVAVERGHAGCATPAERAAARAAVLRRALAVPLAEAWPGVPVERARLERGLGLLRAGLLDEADADFAAALEARPGEPGATQARALARARRGDAAAREAAGALADLAGAEELPEVEELLRRIGGEKGSGPRGS
jgi:GT2 family glycosyltransferase